eukprot:5621128-Pyramimonas_sp.AAC.1
MWGPCSSWQTELADGARPRMRGRDGAVAGSPLAVLVKPLLGYLRRSLDAPLADLARPSGKSPNLS